LGEKENKILLDGDIKDFVLFSEIDIVDCRLKVAVGLELLCETDDEVMATCTFDDLFLDESDLLGQTESSLVVVFDQMVVVFYS
jgi:hypothetical protein